MSIINQIEDVERRAKECQDSLEEIENQLRLGDVGDDRRRSLHDERKRVQDNFEMHGSRGSERRK
eukprot:m.35132 g.35132  ORF g.35132 m.35132 type:complete len:65 (+) comp32066_c1_seq2:241-435(+)